jgi:hypothetical protein
VDQQKKKGPAKVYAEIVAKDNYIRDAVLAAKKAADAAGKNLTKLLATNFLPTKTATGQSKADLVSLFAAKVGQITLVQQPSSTTTSSATSAVGTVATVAGAAGGLWLLAKLLKR